MDIYAQDILSAMKWQLEAGVDELVLDAPTNWLEYNEQPASTPSPEPQAIIPGTPKLARQNTPPPASRSGAIAEARALADAADSLETLRKSVEKFDGCALKATAMQCVFADGNPAAKVMAIGDAPGADEDREGIPFCGATGQLFDKMFSAIGLSREDSLYITNTIFWRPPGNRKPNADEIETCLPFVEKHIALAAPEHLVLLGGTAISALLKDNKGITRLRGNIYSYTNPYLNGKELPVHVLFHPSYLLRQPAHKALAWQDLLNLRSQIN